jgi:MarR family transcriptional regulator, organic hydroperoxide resistance regulator
VNDESLTYRLLRLVHAMDDATNEGIRDVMAELGLTHALADALWQLDPDAQPPTMREMATRQRCDPSTVTFLADRLEQLSFVTRAPAPHDRRTKVLALTSAGRNARQRLVEAATTGTPIAALSRAEQLTLHDLLTKAMTAADAP